MEAVSVAGLLALIYIVVNFLKFLANAGKDRGALSSAVTQALVWIAGILVIWLASAAKITQGLEVWGTTLGQLDFPSILLGGLMAGSLASTGNQVLSAFDNSRTSAAPPLVPPSDNA